MARGGRLSRAMSSYLTRVSNVKMCSIFERRHGLVTGPPILEGYGLDGIMGESGKGLHVLQGYGTSLRKIVATEGRSEGPVPT